MRRIRWAQGLLMVGCTALWVSTLYARHASATDVKGNVSVRSSGAARPPAPTRGTYVREWNGFLQPKEARLDVRAHVAVVLIGQMGGARETQAILCEQGAISPATLVVQAGTSVRVQNNDDFAHELHAVGNEDFKPVETIAGSGRQVQLNKAGNWPLRDRVAPHVRGHVHVLPKVSAVARPNGKGDFVFKGVAPGDYTLKVFLGAEEVSSSQVQVPDGRDFKVDPVAVTAKAGAL